MKKTLITSFVLLLIVSNLFGQAPEGYYDGTTGLVGENLKTKLHHIIKNHTFNSYSAAKDILRDLDEDPNNSDNVLLIYSRKSISKTSFASNNEPDFWNREHTWPKSHGFPDDTDTAYTDVHHLRPCDATVNSSRSNKDFNNVAHIESNEEGEAPDTYTTSDFWEPSDEVKGDMARTMFYMAARYNSTSLDLELVDRISISGDPELGVLFTLLQWHESDPVSQEEIDRNNGVFGYQGYRYPFIDEPSLVSDIWGSASDPLLIINQDAFNADFGLVAAGGSLVQQYKVNGYNLTNDINIVVNTPFALSLDNTNWSQSVSVGINNSEPVESTIYLRFSPTVADGADYESTVTHSSIGVTDKTFTVGGTEGDMTISTIEDARSESLGTAVFVTGVVIDKGNNSGNSRVIYDGSAGIVVRSFDADNESANLNYGDSITVSGGLAAYNNLLQIESSPIVISLIKEGAIIPDPQAISLGDVSEQYESELITIENVEFVETGTFAGGGSAGNFTLTDGTDEVVFRIGNSGHPLVDMSIPTGKVTITGFVSQFGSDYQISPRDVDDVETFEEELLLMSILEARSQSIGDQVLVTGVVIDKQSNNQHNRVIFDGTAGIVIRGLASGHATEDLNYGDSITVSGELFDYNNLLEIEGDLVRYTIISENSAIPFPQEISIENIGEDYESELILLKGISFVEDGVFTTEGNELTDGSRSVNFNLGSSNHPLIGVETPVSEVNVIGFVGEDTDGYYVSIRNEEDIEELAGQVTGVFPKGASFSFSPNPVVDVLSFYGLDRSLNKFDITITTQNGQIIKTGYTVKSKTINIGELARGIYILHLQNGDQKITLKLIKQ